MQLDIRVTNIQGSDALRAHVQERFTKAFGRLSHLVRRAVIRITDTNGPRGGEDMSCAVELRLATGGIVVLNERAHDPYTGVSRLSRRARQTIARSAERARAR